MASSASNMKRPLQSRGKNPIPVLNGVQIHYVKGTVVRGRIIPAARIRSMAIKACSFNRAASLFYIRLIYLTGMFQSVKINLVWIVKGWLDQAIKNRMDGIIIL